MKFKRFFSATGIATATAMCALATLVPVASASHETAPSCTDYARTTVLDNSSVIGYGSMSCWKPAYKAVFTVCVRDLTVKSSKCQSQYLKGYPSSAQLKFQASCTPGHSIYTTAHSQLYDAHGAFIAKVYAGSPAYTCSAPNTTS